MDIISAIKAAQESGECEIARNWWHTGLIIKMDYPMRINKPSGRTKKGYWNPTLNDLLADDWYVVKRESL